MKALFEVVELKVMDVITTSITVDECENETETEWS